MANLRPSVRFDVFKRDNFTCAYCGRRPPTVTLEVDHIIPLAEGGTHDPENLATSCWDCNRGKGAVPLHAEPPAIPNLEERAELVRERERQLRAYHAAKAEERDRREADFQQVWEHWFDVWNASDLARWHTPWESTLRKYVDLLGPDEVMDCMDVARERFRHGVSSNAVRYFVGVLKRRHAVALGEGAWCANRCGTWLVVAEEHRPTAIRGGALYCGPCFEKLFPEET